MKLLELSYTAKVYDLNEANKNINTIRLVNQMYEENAFLRKVNLDTMPQRNVYIINESPIKEKDNMINFKLNNVINNSKHKRQATHINLNCADAETDGDINKSVNPFLVLNDNSSSPNVGISKTNKDDMFSSTIKNMNDTVKCRIRRNNSCKEIKNTEDETNTFPSTNSSFVNDFTNVNNNTKKPLCYNRSLGNKEKKLIEFTK